ncbi:Ras-related protein [Drosera capensis]
MSFSLQKILLKVIVLGDVGVGKTSLIDRYVRAKFNTLHKATIGADFVTKELHIDDKLVNLQIWDTAGQERFQSLGSAFYRGADCCVLVYDVNVLKSFESLQHWHQEFIKQVQSCFALPFTNSQIDMQDSTKFPFVLIGNKIDIDGGIIRTVAEKTAKEWCRLNGDIPYFETSAKENVNVDVAFQCVATAALSHEPDTDICDSLTKKKNSSIKIARTCSFAPPRITSYRSNDIFASEELHASENSILLELVKSCAVHNPFIPGNFAIDKLQILPVEYSSQRTD